MKNTRHKLILDLIAQNEIDTQESLIRHLEANGVKATQTTISRDIRELKIVKGLTARGTYKYVASDAQTEDASFGRTFTDVINKIVSAKNMIVVKTMSGMADAVAVNIDSLGLSQIVGSIAGDDTIFLVACDDEQAKEAVVKLREVFGVR